MEFAGQQLTGARRKSKQLRAVGRANGRRMRWARRTNRECPVRRPGRLHVDPLETYQTRVVDRAYDFYSPVSSLEVTKPPGLTDNSFRHYATNTRSAYR